MSVAPSGKFVRRIAQTIELESIAPGNMAGFFRTFLPKLDLLKNEETQFLPKILNFNISENSIVQGLKLSFMELKQPLDPKFLQKSSI